MIVGDHSGPDFGKTVSIFNKQTGLSIDHSGSQVMIGFGDHSGPDFGKTVPIFNKQTGLSIDHSGSVNGSFFE